MRIVRYELEVVDYQQIQPLSPGTILAVKPGRIDRAPYVKFEGESAEDASLRIGLENCRRLNNQKIDVWCIDDSDNTPSRPPILGVWIVGTGNPMPDAIVNPSHGKVPKDPHMFNGTVLAGGVRYLDTCVMANHLVWHVFTALVGFAASADTGFGEVSSVDDMVDQLKSRFGGSPDV